MLHMAFLTIIHYLMPNVGGYFLQNLVGNIYHYLQYADYKNEFLVSDHKLL